MIGEAMDNKKALEIFFPYMVERVKKVREENTRFVHYTSAEGAMGMLTSRKLWLREVSCMNDFSEVQHGLDCLKDAYNDSEGGLDFRSALEEVAPGVVTQIAADFEKVWAAICVGNYLACFSEHKNNEDEYGRLSMWRAYGETTGVALVLKSDAFFNETNAFNAATSPVAYLGKVEFGSELKRVALSIRAHRTQLIDLGGEQIKIAVLNMFRFAILSTKHQGFHEELEWRVIYSPGLNASTRLKYEVETIKGIPQGIYKLPLENIPDIGLDVGIPAMLDRLIIGPTTYPRAVRDAFVKTLDQIGVLNSKEKVILSNIPLRR